ncbi:MAG: L,D-transpeptidase family protein [Candidatus Kerfeldbacteria bacterium]
MIRHRNFRPVLFVGGGICALAAFVAVTAQPVHAADYRQPEVRVFEMQNKGTVASQQESFLAFDEANENGGTVATGDFNGDGKDEVIVGAGPGSSPTVTVFTPGGAKVSEFLAFGDNVRVGVNVAAGDLNGDGKDEIVVGAGRGGGPQVRVFNMKGKEKFTPGFFAYDEHFRGGVNVAVGNVDGRGSADIITGAGPGGGPHVRVFDKYGNYIGIDFFPFADTDRGGVSVATANVDGGKDEEVVTAIHSFGEPRIKVYKADANDTIISEFLAYDANFRGGVNLASADVDMDGIDEIITAPRQSGGPHIRIFKGKKGKLYNPGFLAYEEDFRGGVSVTAGNVDADAKIEIVTIPQKKIVEGRTDIFKYIDVDLSEQILRAYRNGVKEKEFYVSTGVARYATPTGETEVLAKLPVHDYEWTYGPGHPDNYDLPGVVNNLRFRQHHYIHYAYWHNNFGHVMSHGCINVNLENSQWIYDWADVGDKVIVHE